MVAINKQSLHGVQPIQGNFTDATAAELAGEEAEGQALTVTDSTNPVDWTYGATAENPGSTGEMDQQPGLVYSGPSGITVHVKATQNIIEGGITAPAEGDTFGFAAYVNGTAIIQSEEGVVKDLDVETAVVFNLEGSIPNIQESDVLRFGLFGTGDNTFDLDNVEGTGEWSVS